MWNKGFCKYIWYHCDIDLPERPILELWAKGIIPRTLHEYCIIVWYDKWNYIVDIWDNELVLVKRDNIVPYKKGKPEKLFDSWYIDSIRAFIDNDK